MSVRRKKIVTAIEVLVLVDQRVILKKNKNMITNRLPRRPNRRLKQLWNKKFTFILIIDRALGTIPMKLEKHLDNYKMRREL